MSRFIAFVVCALLAVPSLAQVIYEPVRYQFSGCDQNYCYGGSDASVHARAAYYACRGTHHVAVGAFNDGRAFNEPSPMFPYESVYSDKVMRMDARYFGYTCDDARNEANARVPRYFRKADLLAGAYRAADGSIVVPAQAVPQPAYGDHLYRTMPATAPKGQIIIIPKRMLDRPLKSFEKEAPLVAGAF